VLDNNSIIHRNNINGILKSHGSKKKKHSYTLNLYTPGIKGHAKRNYAFEYKVMGEKNDTDSIIKEV
jgi:hypothetical protein